MINLMFPRVPHELRISTLLWYWLLNGHTNLENERLKMHFPTAPRPCLIIAVHAHQSSTIYLDDLNLRNYVDDETPSSYKLVASITDDHSLNVLNEFPNWTLGWIEHRSGFLVAPSVETRTVTFHRSCIAIYMRGATLPETEPLSGLPVEFDKIVCIREKLARPKLQEDLWSEDVAKVNLGDIRGPPIQAYDVKLAKSSIEL